MAFWDGKISRALTEVNAMLFRRPHLPTQVTKELNRNKKSLRICGHNLNIPKPFTKKEFTSSRRKQTQLEELELSKLGLILDYIKKNNKWMCLNDLNSVRYFIHKVRTSFCEYMKY